MLLTKKSLCKNFKDAPKLGIEHPDIDIKEHPRYIHPMTAITLSTIFYLSALLGTIILKNTKAEGRDSFLQNLKYMYVLNLHVFKQRLRGWAHFHILCLFQY